MSSVPNGGAVIPVTADLTSAYSQLTAFRAAAAQAITVPLSGATALTGATPVGAATFGGAGGGVFTQNPVLASLAAQSGAFNFGNGSSFAGFGSGANTIGAGQSGQQLSGAAQQMQQAAAALLQAALAFRGGGGAPIGFSPSRFSPNSNAPQLEDLAIAQARIDNASNDDLFDGPGGGGKKADAKKEADAKKGKDGKLPGSLTRGFARFASAGFLLREGLNIANEYESYQDQQQLANERFGAGSPGAALQRLRGEQQIKKQILGIPFAGQILSLFPDIRADQRQYDREIYGLEEDQKDYVNQSGINNERLKSSLENGGLGAETRRISGSVGQARTIRSLQDSFTQYGATQAVAEQKLRDSAGELGISDREKSRRNSVLQNLIETDQKNLGAYGENIDAKIYDVIRGGRLENDALRRGTSSVANALGLRGIGANSDFESGLRNSEAEARESGVEGREDAQRSLNDAARATRDAGISRSIAERNSQTAQINAGIARNPIEAITIGNRRDLVKGLLDSTSLDDARSVVGNAAAQQIAQTQRINDQIDRQRLSINSETARFGILNNQNLDPSVRAARASVFSVVNSTQQQEFADFQSGAKGSTVAALARRGQAELQAQAVSRINGLSPEEIDPTRQATSGAGTEDASTILSDIREGIDKLAQIPQSLADLKNALAPLLAP